MKTKEVKKVKRPWGNFKRFTLNKKSTVKILEVKPGQELSLQKHKKRDELWYFLDAGAVRVGNRKFKVKEGDVVFIKKGAIHRVFSGKTRTRFLEVSFGKFSEKDEIRLEDEYNRK